MNEPERICAFYSHGPHYRRMLRFLRERYPAARITALVPPTYPREFLEGQVDDIVVTAQTQYSSRNATAIRQLIQQIRGGGYGFFVVMFDSPRLRILSALTGVAERYCYQADGRYTPVRLSLTRAIANTVWRNLRGRLTYARIWLIVHFRHVERGRR